MQNQSGGDGGNVGQLVDVGIPEISLMDDIDEALRELPPRYDMIRRGTSESTIPGMASRGAGGENDDIGRAL
jgi:hypothetical protein